MWIINAAVALRFQGMDQTEWHLDPEVTLDKNAASVLDPVFLNAALHKCFNTAQ